MKRYQLISYPANMFVKLFLISFLLNYSLGFDIFEDGKRQELIPISNTEWNKILASLDGKSFAGGLMANPRLGRDILELHQALIPSPRAGRLIVDPASLRYDILLNSDARNSGLEDILSDDIRSDVPVVEKRPNIKMIPRIGRKKRSIPDQEEKKEKDAEENERNVEESGPDITSWDILEDYDNDNFYKTDKKSVRIKNAFVPRIGKRLTDFLNEYEEKRAAAFTPRIGRASFIPRIGRNDPRFRLKSRASFVPRIGRRAALIPRIGRSIDSQQNAKEESD